MPKRNKPRSQISKTQRPQTPRSGDHSKLADLNKAARICALEMASQDRETVLMLASAICLSRSAIMENKGLPGHEEWGEAAQELADNRNSELLTGEFEEIIELAHKEFSLFLVEACSMGDLMPESAVQTRAVFQAVVLSVVFGTPQNALAEFVGG